MLFLTDICFLGDISWGYNMHEEVQNIAKRIESWQDFYNEISNLNTNNGRQL